MSAAAECSTDSLGAVFDRRVEGMMVYGYLRLGDNTHEVCWDVQG
jgi:hypothetical protein